MKKLILAFLFPALLLALVACKGGTQGEIEYEGKYTLTSVYIFGEQRELSGQATLKLEKDGALTFHSTVNFYGFSLHGSWKRIENEREKLAFVLIDEAEERVSVTATCDGETVTVSYSDALFTLKKE